jgi:hypothetical protein
LLLPLLVALYNIDVDEPAGERDWLPMAILVARLVGLQMSRSAGQHTENDAAPSAPKNQGMNCE